MIRRNWQPAFLFFIVALVYFFSNLNPGGYYDYTYRIALALLEGRLGLTSKPPAYLNEFVPFGDEYFSVFPIGAVLTVFPVALLAKLGVLSQHFFPARILLSLTAGAVATFTWLLAQSQGIDRRRCWVLALFIVFGTWMWANLCFGGAWQLALGFAVLGELGALYFCLARPRPFLAGFFFAMAFGNRSEIVLTAPLFLWLYQRQRRLTWPVVIRFCAVPFALGIATLAYNYARFGSPLDFGYAKIPGVLSEPWYRDGIFSWRYMSYNAYHMLVGGWRRLREFPYLMPGGFGGSILISSPYLLLLFRPSSGQRTLTLPSVVALGLLTAVLWCHGNAGGWQVSYRYAMVLLPWILLVFLERRKIPLWLELSFLLPSIAINAWSTYLFLWTEYMRP